MSKKTEDDEGKAKKGKKGLMVKLMLGLVLMAAGGGGAFGMMQAGLIGGEHEEEDNSPKLVRKGEEDPYAPPTKEKEGEGAAEVFGEGGSKYRTAYFSFGEDFTSNLRHSDALVQVSIAASTQRDGRVLLWMKKHELAIRSADPRGACRYARGADLFGRRQGAPARAPRRRDQQGAQGARRLRRHRQRLFPDLHRPVMRK